ncbi:MAG: hypothetical protein C4521_10885 [Actinobacteria bacterium]|nr:MAG: hypothetical protein C4521_10885 [Actinomycetota bacterium]
MQFFRAPSSLFCETLFCGQPAAYFIGVPDHPIGGKFPAKIVCLKCAEELVLNLPPELKKFLMPPEDRAECPMCSKVYTGRLARAHLKTHIERHHDYKEEE